MIHVDRSQANPPARLIEPSGAGVAETKAALEFYQDPANEQEKFGFEQYRHSDVKRVLVELFHAKCAYCESSVSGAQDGDVEHFRPKGAIEIGGRSVKPGYFWLAAVWTNLYLSCMHCNQRRKHRTAKGGRLKAGKADKFPVADEARRARAVNLPIDLVDADGNLDLARLQAVCDQEEPLLLDPCDERDDPVRHLFFREDGMVVAVTDPEGRPDPKGHASIHTLGLHRPQLVNDRATELVKIQEDIDLVREMVARLDQDPQNPTVRQVLLRMLAQLETHCLPEQRFSGMARQIVDRFKSELLD